MGGIHLIILGDLVWGMKVFGPKVGVKGLDMPQAVRWAHCHPSSHRAGREVE